MAGSKPTPAVCASHRRRIIIALSALFALFAIDLAVRRLAPALRPYDTNLYTPKEDHIRRAAMPEIVLMGSSRAKYAFVPDDFRSITGARAYNLGVSGTKVVEWQCLVRKLFSQRSPRMIVLGVNASEFRADYEPTLAARHDFDLDDAVSYLVRDDPSVDVAGAFLQQSIGPLWALYDHRYELKMWGQERLSLILPTQAQEARELRERYSRPAPDDGFDHPWLHGRQLVTLGERLLADERRVVFASTPAYSPDAPAFNHFRQMLRWLADRRIATLVAYVPNCPSAEARWQAVEPRMIERIGSICSEGGVPFLPCPIRDLPRSDDEFLEEVHVGLPLAHRISQRIAHHIVAVGLLSRDESQFARQDGAEDGPP